MHGTPVRVMCLMFLVTTDRPCTFAVAASSPAPLLRHRARDPENPVVEAVDRAAQPSIQRRRARPVASLEALDPLPQFADRENAEVDLIVVHVSIAEVRR